jgi:hypothetical protein
MFTSEIVYRSGLKKKNEMLDGFRNAYFFFLTFFSTFFAALATLITSEIIIGFNLYLKFVKGVGFCSKSEKSSNIGAII